MVCVVCLQPRPGARNEISIEVNILTSDAEPKSAIDVTQHPLPSRHLYTNRHYRGVFCVRG